MNGQIFRHVLKLSGRATKTLRQNYDSRVGVAASKLARLNFSFVKNARVWSLMKSVRCTNILKKEEKKKKFWMEECDQIKKSGREQENV